MKLILFILLFLQCSYIIAQESRFSIEGNGRGINQSLHLNEKDSLNNDIDFESNVIVDLGIRANLNEKVNFYSQIRMRSNLALFDTSRSNIFIRQFRLYGNFNDLFYYELDARDGMEYPMITLDSVLLSYFNASTKAFFALNKLSSLDDISEIYNTSV